MNNNNKRCPICRSEMMKQTCKKCGFKENKIRIGENQEAFGRLSYMNRIRNSQSINKNKTQITSQQMDIVLVKLKLYLKGYVKVMREGARRICEKKEFTVEEKDRLGKQIFQTWKGYLLKIRKLNLHIGGIFKKYIFAKKHKTPQQQSKHIPSRIQDDQINSQQKIQLKSEQIQTQQLKVAHKRQRKTRRSKNQPIIIDPKANFRSYYLTSVKPLIRQSQEQQRNDKKCLTKCQRHFLSYLIGQKEVDDQFLELASMKYIKMLQIIRKQKSDSYLKQKQIQYELKLRNRTLQHHKQHSLLIIILIDTIICLSLTSVHLPQTIDLSELLQFYQSSSYNNQFINKILSKLAEDQAKEDHTIPLINYELIYSIIYIGCLRIGKCISISQVLYNCGLLEIEEIVYSQGKEDVVLPPIINQQYMSCSKIRRNCHLLKAFLQIDLRLYPLQWSQKWCLKFKLQYHLKPIQYLNNMILREISLNTQKAGFNLHEQMLNNGKIIKYVRCIQLQQDIACLTGILVYLKLTHGLTNYPYLINFMSNHKTEALFQQTQVEHIKFIKSLLQNRQILIKNTQTNTLIQKSIPKPYKTQLSLINISQLSQTLTRITTTDKEYNMAMLNRNLLKITNLSNLNYLTSNQILAYLQRIKRFKLGGEDRNYEIVLRYNENGLKSFCRDGKIVVKRNKNKEIDLQNRDKAALHDNLIRQIQVIIKPGDQWLKQSKPLISQSQLYLNQQCLLDYPSSNYQLMLEYTNDKLTLSQRSSQLHIIQLFCLNLCSYNELTNWLSKYQAVLKQYQI